MNSAAGRCSARGAERHFRIPNIQFINDMERYAV